MYKKANTDAKIGATFGIISSFTKYFFADPAMSEGMDLKIRVFEISIESILKQKSHL